MVTLITVTTGTREGESENSALDRIFKNRFVDVQKERQVSEMLEESDVAAPLRPEVRHDSVPTTNNRQREKSYPLRNLPRHIIVCVPNTQRHAFCLSAKETDVARQSSLCTLGCAGNRL